MRKILLIILIFVLVNSLLLGCVQEEKPGIKKSPAIGSNVKYNDVHQEVDEEKSKELSKNMNKEIESELEDGKMDEFKGDELEPPEFIIDLPELPSFPTIELVTPKYKTVRVNWSNDTRIASLALNADAIANGDRQLPVYCIGDVQDVEDFKAKFAGCFSFDRGGQDSFAGVMAEYDEKFFEHNSIIVVYVTSGSGSNRFGVASVNSNNGVFSVEVANTYSPEIGTCDMAGWFMIIEVADEDLNSCVEFAATMQAEIGEKELRPN